MKEPDRRQETILAYLLGEMGESERIEFERSLRESPELTRECENLRKTLDITQDWLEADPPGIERVDKLEIEHSSKQSSNVVPLPSISIRHNSSLLRQSVAAAVLFAAGFIFGHQWQTEPIASIETAIQPVATPEAMAEPAPQNPETVHLTQAQPTAPNPNENESYERHTRIDTQGRTIIETSQPATGARAVWVVDGGFQIAASGDTAGGQ